MDGIPNSLEDLAGKQVLSVLLSLLPGLIASEIIYALTVREKKDVVDRVINALVHTFAIYVIWQGMIAIVNIFIGRRWTPTASTSLICLGICSVFWGLLCSWIINADCIRSSLQHLGVTASSSHPSEWYTAFYSSRGRRYVTIHLKDGRRIFGWPTLWSNDPKDGHLFITSAEWLDLDKKQDDYRRSEILIDVADVSYVEFVPLAEERGAIGGQEIIERRTTSQQTGICGGNQGGSELRGTDRSQANTSATASEADHVRPEGREVSSV